MRHGFLVRSVQRLLRPDETLLDLALIWRRHRLMVPYTAAVSVGLVVLSAAVGMRTWPTLLGIGAAGAVVASTATTDYRVLVRTTRGLILCRAGRLRQVARSVLDRPAGPVRIERTGGNMVAGDWQVGGEHYSVPRRHEQAMGRIAEP